MWPFIKPINLIRYLMVWRVNSSLVWQPNYLPVDISLTLGSIIANRLPSRQAHLWRKSLAPWNKYYDLSQPVKKGRQKDDFSSSNKIIKIPDASWPLESALFAYPGKKTYGEGELILWELKLMGESADHNLFLEIILPAIEEASQTGNLLWHHKNSLWGNFDVEAIYAARGAQWKPIVEEGRLDLHYRPTPIQWAEGLEFSPKLDYRFNRITWLTPFDLGLESDAERRRARRRHRAAIKPTLQSVTDALLDRMAQLLPGKFNTRDDALALLDDEEREAFQRSLKQAARIPIHHQKLKKAPKNAPGRLIGSQLFPSIPQPILPYLQLASILHIGQFAHFGCGTFVIDNYT